MANGERRATTHLSTTMNGNQQKPQASRQRHAPGSVRHAEKRRTGTCQFVDRIAATSLEAYRTHVPESFQEQQKQTCVAAIVAHFASDGHLQVMGMGVGTKFLSEAVLRSEERDDEQHGGANSSNRRYGTLVRDCHAEVLARRAFRRQLLLEMKCSVDDRSIGREYRPIMKQTLLDNGVNSFQLVEGVTLHFYSSSAPCGNAVLKKFAKMEKETFNTSLGPDEWPESSHEPVAGHSLRLGQFALLVKKDSAATAQSTEASMEDKTRNPTNGKPWPANTNDDWCPPGTSIVPLRKGSLHTCSDKICRWNVLGLQGSLLASVLRSPLYMSTITVGRKFSSVICRRAVCCRASGLGKKGSGKKRKKRVDETTSEASDAALEKYSLHHPAIMGTGVYMDTIGFIDMTDAHTRDQDAQFNSSLAWVWWPLIGMGNKRRGTSPMAECIDGRTGLTYDYYGAETATTEDSSPTKPSLVSTQELLQLFSQVNGAGDTTDTIKTLQDLCEFKRQVSPEYEAAKDELLSQHRVFRQWKRRHEQVQNIN